MRRLLINLWFSVSIITLLLFSSCATTYYAGDSYYTTEIDSYGDYNLKGKKFFVEPGMKDVSENDLQFKEFKSIISKSFIRKEAIETQLRTEADIVVLLQYGISDPQTYQENIPVPIWGRTGISSSTTTTNTRSNTYGNAYLSAYSSGGTTTGNVYGSATTNKNTTSSTQYNYSYGVTGVANRTVTRTEYFRFCNVYAYDNNTQSDEMLWKTSISSSGSSGDLRVVLPYLVFTGMDFYGINTGKKISLSTANNNSVDLLKETETKTSSNIIYNPQQTSNAKLTYITEIDFNSDATRFYIRTIGNSGQGITISKKTTMIVNGVNYLISGCSTALRPDRLTFQRDGQVYDFYIEFPALNKAEISTIEIVEPEDTGWNFKVQLK
jgi:hypothetical protein